MASPTRPDSAAFERLLDGQVHDGSPVANLLEVARAPGRPADLVGLEVARAAFLADRVRRPRHRAQRHRLSAITTRRIVAVKAVAAAAGMTLVGGVAFAASGHGLLEDTTVHHPTVVHKHSSGSSRSQLGSPGQGGGVVIGPAPGAQNPGLAARHHDNEHGNTDPNGASASHTPSPHGHSTGPASGAPTSHPANHGKHKGEGHAAGASPSASPSQPALP